MIQKVNSILEDLKIPIQYLVRPDITTSKIGISYHFFNQGYELYADGKGEELGGVLQVDVFSTVDYTAAVKSVKELLEAARFRLADMRDGDDGLEENMRHYHKIMVFNYTEKEVL